MSSPKCGETPMRSLKWTPASRPGPLMCNQVHLWLIHISALYSSNSKKTESYNLSKSECARADRIADPSKRKLYIGGREGLRKLLSEYLGIPANQIQLAYGSRGKPAINSDQGSLRFNYSVSSDYALYAIAAARELGVDLEVYPRTVNWRRLSKRILTQKERLVWNTIPDSKKNQAMLVCWTRKEAYGKLLGVGIRFNLNQVTLFAELASDTWSTPVTGLFDSGIAMNSRTLCGVQISLPVSGSATLMYDAMADDDPHHTNVPTHPDILAYEYRSCQKNET